MSVIIDGTTGITTPTETIATSATIAGVNVVAVAPSTAGNVLTSTGSAWASTAPASPVPTPSAIGQIPFSTNGSTYTATQKITQDTAQASTSGTSIDFTSIPSWVKRITVMFVGVSTSGTNPVLIQLGISSGPITTGYIGTVVQEQQSQNNVVSTLSSGFLVTDSTGSLEAQTLYGAAIFSQFSSTSWMATGLISNTTTTVRAYEQCGYVPLGATLDRVRITTVNGTDTFDAGSINILYE
jgi:hypothetical protein